MRRMMKSASLAVIAGALGACALILDWDPAGLPCDEEKRCADGYSCLVNRCVEEGSLPLATTCSQPEQCAGYPDVTCGSNPFTCRTSCSDLFGAPGDCQGDEYCRPERPEPAQQWIGTCFPSECHHEEDCRSGICVPISDGAGACLNGCSYNFNTGSYGDTCASVDEYCQPIGKTDDQRLVCLEAFGDRELLGSFCDPVENPCANALVCVNSVCRKYCSSTANCPPPPDPLPAACCESGFFCQAFVDSASVVVFSACVPN